MMAAQGELLRLKEVADDVLSRRAQREPALAMASRRDEVRLGSVASETVHGDAVFYASCLARLKTIDVSPLAPKETSFLNALRVDLENRVRVAQFCDLDFVVTPYRGGDLHVDARRAFAAQPIALKAQREAFMLLVRDYGRLLTELRIKTESQLAQGLRLAAPAVLLARTTLRDLLASLHKAVMPGASSLEDLDGAERAGFLARLNRLVESELTPPVEQLIGLLDDDYLRRAPQGVGLSQYPGGLEYYAALIRERADSERAPEAIQQLGFEEIERLAAQKARLRQALAPGMEARDFDHMVQTDPRWKARTPADVEACFLGHMRRIEPVVANWFGRLPGAPWAVTRAEPAVEAGMSYGYYQRPTLADPVGRYRYNGSGLDSRSMIGAAHLIYHELLPGHHLQLSLQREGELVHPLQGFLYSMASAEGWAVYSSELANEMGMLEGFDLYGHCVMQSWLAARLVVDTGLNALGWTLDRAAAFMREHTVESNEVIGTELLRYATDIPAQALAYDLGCHEITAMRKQAQRTFGSAFDVRSFHDAVLEVGGYPLQVIASHVEKAMDAHSPSRTHP